MFPFGLLERFREQHGAFHADAGQFLIAQSLQHAIDALAAGGETFLGNIIQMSELDSFFLGGETGYATHGKTSLVFVPYLASIVPRRCFFVYPLK